MDDRNPTTTSDSRTRFELIFASIWLAIGLFLMPAIIFWVGVVLLGPYGEGQGGTMSTFYADFFGDLAQGQVRAWVLALGPLVLVYLLRGIFAGPRAAKPVERDEADVDDARISATRKAADARRVEPRIEP